MDVPSAPPGRTAIPGRGALAGRETPRDFEEAGFSRLPWTYAQAAFASSRDGLLRASPGRKDAKAETTKAASQAWALETARRLPCSRRLARMDRLRSRQTLSIGGLNSASLFGEEARTETRVRQWKASGPGPSGDRINLPEDTRRAITSLLLDGRTAGSGALRHHQDRNRGG